jgi:16S rRNA (cytosine1402-N4)-methyltransferase
MDFSHISVLRDETINSLNIKPDGIYVDGTLGGGGHSEEILKRLTTGKLIGIDQDPDALKAAGERLKEYKNFISVKGNFRDIKNILNNLGISKVDGVLLDIGVSSFQLDSADRGFSYHSEAPLDMRMSKSGLSAEDVVNDYSKEELSNIFFKYGEEKFSRKIAEAIVNQREIKRITNTLQLADIISSAVPAKSRRDGHPARKVFQAIRIEVNNELSALEEGIDGAFDLLNKDGILSIITFHSLEDRIVKEKFRDFATGCTCPKDFPVCICGKTPKGELVTRKGIKPTEKEIKENKRSRSATLRSIKKL